MRKKRHVRIRSAWTRRLAIADTLDRLDGNLPRHVGGRLDWLGKKFREVIVITWQICAVVHLCLLRR